MDKRAPVDHPVHELIASRWSPYVFSSRPIASEDLRALFEAARWAPSCFNEQPWRYLVGERSNAEAFERILSCLAEGNRQWAQHAPVLALGVVFSFVSGIVPAMKAAWIRPIEVLKH